MRVHFAEQLDLLNSELSSMGGLCEEAIMKSANALIRQDPFLAHEVSYLTGEIDEKENQIVGLCYKLLLQQQPVASDLRLISAAMKMVTDMERIGTQAGDISEIVRSASLQRLEPRMEHIREMANATVDMVNGAITAFIKRDLEMAQAVMDYDDVVDGLFDSVRNELVEMISSTDYHDGGQALGEAAMDLLMVAKYLERIGDHAVNIAGWVEFSITGKQPESD